MQHLHWKAILVITEAAHVHLRVKMEELTMQQREFGIPQSLGTLLQSLFFLNINNKPNLKTIKSISQRDLAGWMQNCSLLSIRHHISWVYRKDDAHEDRLFRGRSRVQDTGCHLQLGLPYA